MTALYFVLLLVMTLLGAVASLFFKKASSCSGAVKVLKNTNLYIGGFLYLASAVLNIIVLRKLDYSLVLPLTSITYAWTMIISYLILKERISRRKIGGVILIIIGAVSISI